MGANEDAHPPETPRPFPLFPWSTLDSHRRLLCSCLSSSVLRRAVLFLLPAAVYQLSQFRESSTPLIYLIHGDDEKAIQLHLGTNDDIDDD